MAFKHARGRVLATLHLPSSSKLFRALGTIAVASLAVDVIACSDVAAPRASPHTGGQLLWYTRGSGFGSPAFDKKRVYYLQLTHEVAAVGSEAGNSGQILWHSPTGGGVKYYPGQSSVIVDSLVVSGDIDLFAYDRSTGALKWRFTPTVGYWPGLFDLATVGTTIYTGSPSAYVYAVDGITGTQKWATRAVIDTSLISVFNPSADSDIVVASFTNFTGVGNGGAVALDAQTGAVRWRVYFPHTASDLGTGSPGGALLTPTSVIAVASDGPVYCLDRKTGKTLWSTKRLNVNVGTPERDVRYLALSRDRVIVTSLTGYAAAYNLANGKQLWLTPTVTLNSQSAVAADDSIAYISDYGGDVTAIDAKTGAIRWKVGNFDLGFISKAAIDSDRVYLVGTGGLFAVKK